MKILTKKKQERLMNDLLDIFLSGSDALKSIGTDQPIDKVQAMLRQMKMIGAAMDAANIIEGRFGNLLLMEVQKQKAEMEKQQGFPLEMKI